MILLFELIAITSMLVLGYTIVTQENMLLSGIRKWAVHKHDLGSKWVEPVLLCHWCQPSVWTSLGFFFAWGIGLITQFNWHLLFYYPLCVAGSSIVCGFLWGWHQRTQTNMSIDEQIRGLMQQGEDDEDEMESQSIVDQMFSHYQKHDNN